MDRKGNNDMTTNVFGAGPADPPPLQRQPPTLISQKEINETQPQSIDISVSIKLPEGAQLTRAQVYAWTAEMLVNWAACGSHDDTFESGEAVKVSCGRQR
jgi:hypothetical protein